jgi:multiple sugar transport system permease protein
MTVQSPRRTAAPYGFLLPAGALFSAFFAAPAVYAVYLSLRSSVVSGAGIGLRTERFVGLGQYQEVLGDPEFWGGLRRMLLYSAIVVPFMMGIALAFALLLDSPYARLARFSRISIFLPYAVPGVVATLLWGFLYLPMTSPFNDVVQALGLGTFEPLTSSGIYPAVSNVAVWGGTGFNMLILYTSLRAVPCELYDAARIDGCDEWQLAWRVKIPLLAPSLIMTGLFATISTLQVFNEPQTLRPLTNSISSTWMPMMKVYRDAFTNADPYSAAAGAVVLATASLLLSLTVLRIVRTRAFGEDR